MSNFRSELKSSVGFCKTHKQPERFSPGVHVIQIFLSKMKGKLQIFPVAMLCHEQSFSKLQNCYKENIPKLN